ncbi:hypothetical protein BDD12DRAFT_386332 [Trichophaea hybrida]|nr:hypothetical protein BDD12DRAFT_386332 [Trichophaea hybrida]
MDAEWDSLIPFTPLVSKSQQFPAAFFPYWPFLFEQIYLCRSAACTFGFALTGVWRGVSDLRCWCLRMRKSNGLFTMDGILYFFAVRPFAFDKCIGVWRFEHVIGTYESSSFTIPLTEG